MSREAGNRDLWPASVILIALHGVSIFIGPPCIRREFWATFAK